MASLKAIGDSRDAPKPGRKTNRRAAPRECLPADRVEIGKFSKNRGGEAVIVSLEPFQGITLISVRVHYVDLQGKLRPGPKGISLRISQLPKLTCYLLKAEDKARELGLISDEGEA